MHIKSKITKIFQYFQTIFVPRKTPENIIILCTIPRSGSTWLSDLLCCHPSINYFQRYSIYEELKISGRRYPVDLTGIDGANRLIETSPYILSLIHI